MGVGEAAADGKRKDESGGGGGGKRTKAESERDWARLADDALFCIFRAIVLSGHATSAFAAVCRPWRALAASSKKLLSSAVPPLLLQPTWGEAAMCPIYPRSARRMWRPGPTRPSLRAASPGGAAAAAQPLAPPTLPERFLRTREVCQSRGYLVTVDVSTGRPVLTNSLTGEELGQFPPLEKQFGDYVVFRMIAAVLGDPSSGPGDCRLVLYCEDCIFRTCVSGAATWDTSPWEHLDDYPLRLAIARGRVYALLSRGDLLMFDFMLGFHYCRISLKDTPPEAFMVESRLTPSMVEHGGRLFVVHCRFLPSESMPCGIRFSVHRLVRRQWVEQKSLDGLALFVDMAGSGSALLRAQPSQWGGKENHVYVSGQLWNGWKVFPFGDLIKPEQIPMENTMQAYWPTPLWTLPCACY